MTLNPLVWELIGKLIFIHFLMQLLSTFEHAIGTFAVCTGPMVINYGLGNRLEKIASGLVLGSVTGEVPF